MTKFPVYIITFPTHSLKLFFIPSYIHVQTNPFPLRVSLIPAKEKQAVGGTCRVKHSRKLEGLASRGRLYRDVFSAYIITQFFQQFEPMISIEVKQRVRPLTPDFFFFFSRFKRVKQESFRLRQISLTPNFFLQGSPATSPFRSRQISAYLIFFSHL